MIGVCVNGCQSVFYIAMKQDSPGCELFQKAAGVSVELQLLVHEGKLVSPSKSLLKQGFLHGISVFLLTRNKGGGKDDPLKTSSYEDTIAEGVCKY